MALNIRYECMRCLLPALPHHCTNVLQPTDAFTKLLEPLRTCLMGWGCTEPKEVSTSVIGPFLTAIVDTSAAPQKWLA